MDILEVRGRFKVRLTRNGVKSQQEIYIIRNLSRALLGRPAIQALKVAVLVDKGTMSCSSFQSFSKASES